MFAASLVKNLPLKVAQALENIHYFQQIMCDLGPLMGQAKMLNVYKKIKNMEEGRILVIQVSTQAFREIAALQAMEHVKTTEHHNLHWNLVQSPI